MPALRTHTPPAMHPYHPFRISGPTYTPPRKLGKLGKFHPSPEPRPGPGKISLSAVDTTCGAYKTSVGGRSSDRPALSAPAYPLPSVMSQQEPFPFAPLVERCFELVVDISAEQFEEEAAAFMEAVGAALDLSEHKTIEHWEIRIDKPKNGPPKPKATLYSTLTVSRPGKALRGEDRVETVHLIPPTQSGRACLIYSQFKPINDHILGFGDAKERLKTILNLLQQKVGAGLVQRTSLSYWNDLYRFDDPYFQGDTFNLTRTLRFFKKNENEIQGTLLPPWNLSLNWSVPPGEAILHLDIKAELKMIDDKSLKNQLWTTLIYIGKMSETGGSPADCLKELELAHASIYEKFESILTPEALQYCRNGNVNDPTPQP
jgi:hypothetical protein